MASHLTQYSYTVRHWINTFIHEFMATGSSHSVAKLQSMKMISLGLTKQTLMITYEEAFYVVGLFSLICIPALLFTFVKKKNQKDRQSANSKTSRKQKTAVEAG